MGKRADVQDKYFTIDEVEYRATLIERYKTIRICVKNISSKLETYEGYRGYDDERIAVKVEWVKFCNLEFPLLIDCRGFFGRTEDIKNKIKEELAIRNSVEASLVGHSVK